MEIPLADAVSVLREELLEAVSRGMAESLVFEVGPIELDFEASLRAEAKVGGGFKIWWVLETKAEASGSGSRSHHVKLALNPKNLKGEPLLIRGAKSSASGPGDVSKRIPD